MLGLHLGQGIPAPPQVQACSPSPSLSSCSSQTQQQSSQRGQVIVEPGAAAAIAGIDLWEHVDRRSLAGMLACLAAPNGSACESRIWLIDATFRPAARRPTYRRLFRESAGPHDYSEKFCRSYTISLTIAALQFAVPRTAQGWRLNVSSDERYRQT